MGKAGNVQAGDRHEPPPRRGLARLARATGLVRGSALLLGVALAAPGAARAGAGGDRPAASAQRNQIVQVDSSAEGQATWIRLRGTRPASFTVHRLEQPARIVIDVPHAQLAPAVRDGGWNVSSWAVDRVTAQQNPRAGTDAVRVVVWLARPSTYRVANEGRDLVVRLTARDAAPPPGSVQAVARPGGVKAGVKARPVRVRADRQPDKDDVAEDADDAGDDDPRDGDVDEGAAAARPPTPGASRTLAAAEKAALTQRAEARRAVTKAKRARRAANHAVRKHRRNSTQLRMQARKLEAIADELCARAETAERNADQLRAEAEEAEAAKTRIAAAPTGKAAPAAPTGKAAPAAPTGKAAPAAAGKVAPRPLPQRQVASTAAAAPPAAARRPVTPPASTPSGAPAPATATPLRRPPATNDYPSPAVAGYGESSGPISQQSVSQIQQRRRKVYRGRKIDLDLKDADVHNLMRLLADVGGVNIVVPDNVKASITVRLRDVPWDQAMEVILASKGLWYRREGGLIRVAPRKELDAEDQAEAERIRALAESEAPETQVFTLNYADAGKVRDQLTPLLSPKGRIEVDARTNSLIINDISAHRRRIVGLVTQLDYQTPQIQIEARVVEARTDWNREFGIQWGGSVNASAAGGNSTGLVFPNSVNVTGGADGPPSGGVVASPSDFAVNLPAGAGPGAGGALGLSLGSVGGNFNLNLRLSAAEETGTVRIISAPRITTSNNIEASIKSGTSIPISVISANGVQTQFVPADLLLRVTPAVSQRDCAISMQVNITKNEADFVNTGARGDPSILTKEAKTTILVADGQTAVIGGIYTRNTGVGYNKVPFLADLPVLGWLFKFRTENDNRTEVLVFITPKITNRAFLRCE